MTANRRVPPLSVSKRHMFSRWGCIAKCPLIVLAMDPALVTRERGSSSHVRACHDGCLRRYRGRAVDVQVQIGPGLPAFAVVGLPDKAVAESRERVRGARPGHQSTPGEWLCLGHDRLHEV